MGIEKSQKNTPRRVDQRLAQQKPKNSRSFIEKNIKRVVRKAPESDRDIFLLGKDGNLKDFGAEENLFEDFSDTSLSPGRFGLTKDPGMQNLQNLDPIRILAS